MSVTEKDREAARSTLLAYVEDNRHFEPTVEAIAAAIARARAEEREACAQLANGDYERSMEYPGANRWDDAPAAAKRIESRIRARGNDAE